jgi:uncharacterized membrane protein YjjB (DUF3815 family)
MNELTTIVVNVVVAGVAALGFGVLFNVPRRGLFGVALTGATAALVQMLALQLHFAHIAATFLAAAAVGASSQLLARRLAMPAYVFSTTGFIPLVPGVAAYTAVMEFAQHNLNAGLESAVTALSLTLAIGAGLGVVDALMKAKWR